MSGLLLPPSAHVPEESDPETPSAIPTVEGVSEEYMKRMKTLSDNIDEVVNWIFQHTNGQVQITPEAGAKLQHLIVFMVSEGMMTPEQFERMNLDYMESFLRDAKNARRQISSAISRQQILAGSVPGGMDAVKQMFQPPQGK